MNQISPVWTGGATFTATQLEPIFQWALTGFHQPAPPMLPGALAALTFAIIHFAGNSITAWLNRRAASR
jgi:hypothetical protein